jgi:hypothetical protein
LVGYGLFSRDVIRKKIRQVTLTAVKGQLSDLPLQEEQIHIIRRRKRRRRKISVDIY